VLLVPEGSVVLLVPEGSVVLLVPESSVVLLVPEGSVVLLVPEGGVALLVPESEVVLVIPEGWVVLLISEGDVVLLIPDVVVVVVAAVLSNIRDVDNVTNGVVVSNVGVVVTAPVLLADVEAVVVSTAWVVISTATVVETESVVDCGRGPALVVDIVSNVVVSIIADEVCASLFAVIVDGLFVVGSSDVVAGAVVSLETMSITELEAPKQKLYVMCYSLKIKCSQ